MIAALRGDIFFSSRKGAEAQRNCGLIDLTSGGLGGFAALRAKYFFYFLLSQSPPRRAK
jgi:hypothetical protein